MENADNFFVKLGDEAVDKFQSPSLDGVPPELPDSIAITPARPGCIAKIVCDQRETHSAVIKELDRIRVHPKTKQIFSLPRFNETTNYDPAATCLIDFELRTLSVADYVISSRVAAERKTADDFLSTFLERKEIFSQLHDLKMAYRRPLLIIEGEGGQGALFSNRMIDAAAIWGVLQTITISFRIPILYTNDPAETARVLSQIAIREQHHEHRAISLHGKRSHMSVTQLQEYIVTSIPDVGPATAHRLLARFGSVEGVMRASREELIEVDKIAGKSADKLRAILTAKYNVVG